MVSSQGRGKQRWKWWPRLRLDPRPHMLSRSCSHEGSDSIVVSIALKTGILFHSHVHCAENRDFVHYGLHLPAPLVLGRTLEKQGWGLSWPRTMPRPRLLWSFLKFHKASSPVTGPAPPLSLCSCVSSKLWSSRQGLCWRPWACQWRDGVVRFFHGNELFLPGPRLGWLCSGSNESVIPPAAGWHKGIRCQRWDISVQGRFNIQVSQQSK